jgi:excisionase family DNA binding protein
VVDGGRVRALRRAACLTQAQLGAAAGVDQGRISQIEAGRIARPACLPELAAALGVAGHELLTLSTSPTPPPGPEALAWWTASQAAAELGTGRKAVYRLVRSGQLQARRAGRSRRLSPQAVRACRARYPAAAAPRVPVIHQHPALAAALGVPVADLQRPAGRRPAPSSASPPAAAAAGVTGQHPVDEPGPHLDGARLRALRTSRGMTQAEVAARAGLSRSFISTLERGHRTRASVIPATARALGAAPAGLTTAGQPPGQPPPLPVLTPVGAARLRELRSLRGLTQVTLATRAGLTPAFISGLENRRHTRTRSVPALAAALGTTAARLAARPAGAPP